MVTILEVQLIVKQHEKLVQSSGILFARNRVVEYVGQWMSHEWEDKNNYKLVMYIEGLSPSSHCSLSWRDISGIKAEKLT